MRNTKEVKAILTTIYCINYTGNSDKDIHNILKYAYMRLFGDNANLVTLCCIGKSKEQMMPEVTQLLKTDTEHMKYLQNIKEIK